MPVFIYSLALATRPATRTGQPNIQQHDGDQAHDEQLHRAKVLEHCPTLSPSPKPTLLLTRSSYFTG